MNCLRFGKSWSVQKMHEPVKDRKYGMELKVKKYLVNWQARSQTSYVEIVRANSLEDAKKQVIAKYKDYPGFENSMIEIISVKEVN